MTDAFSQFDQKFVAVATNEKFKDGRTRTYSGKVKILGDFLIITHIKDKRTVMLAKNNIGRIEELRERENEGEQ